MEVSRFLGYFFDSIKNKKQLSKKYSKIHFNLDCGRAEATLSKPKFKIVYYRRVPGCPGVIFQVSASGRGAI